MRIIPPSGCARRFGCLLLGLVVVAGCAARPELRAVDDRSPAVSITAGRQLLDQGKAVEAVAAFRRLLREDGPDLRVLNGLAIAYSELGRADLAADMFTRALDLAPDDPATLNNIGFAALRRADAKLARYYLERARAGNADLAEIEGNLRGLDLLEIMDRRGPSDQRLIPAALTSPETVFPRTRRLPLKAVDHGRRPPKAEAPSSAPPAPDPSDVTPALIDFAPALIDFTDVIDPFSKRPKEETPEP